MDINYMQVKVFHEENGPQASVHETNHSKKILKY